MSANTEENALKSPGESAIRTKVLGDVKEDGDVSKSKGLEDRDVSNVTIEDLPQEILLHIFSFFSHIERILTITPVCRSWRALSRDSSFLRELTLDADDCGNPSSDAVFLLKATSHHLKSLFICDRNDTNCILLQVSKSNRKLENLMVRRCRGTWVEPGLSAKLIRRVLVKCTELRCVRIKNSGCANRVFKGKLVPNSLRHLQVLDLGYGPHYLTRVLNLAVYGIGYHQVEAFFAQFTSRDEDVRTLAEACTDNLEELQLNGVLWSDRAVDFLVKCKKLRALHIRFAGHLTSQSLEKLSRLERLKVLDISLVDNVPSAVWASLVGHPNLQNLSKLCLSLNWQVNDIVLDTISTNCKQLEKISLAGNSDISVEGLTKIIMRCSRLVHINLYFTPRGLAECFYLIPVHLPGLQELVVGPMMRRDLFQKSLDRLKKQLTTLQILMHPV